MLLLSHASAFKHIPTDPTQIPFPTIVQAATRHSLAQFRKWHTANQYKSVIQDGKTYYFCPIVEIKKRIYKNSKNIWLVRMNRQIRYGVAIIGPLDFQID